jgi:hypothetical protein
MITKEELKEIKNEAYMDGVKWARKYPESFNDDGIEVIAGERYLDRIEDTTFECEFSVKLAAYIFVDVSDPKHYVYWETLRNRDIVML